MKTIIFTAILCLFTMPGYADDLKGKLGSPEFCASMKEFANTTLNTYRFTGKRALLAQEKNRWSESSVHLKRSQKNLQYLSNLSTVYGTWCASEEKNEN